MLSKGPQTAIVMCK